MLEWIPTTWGDIVSLEYGKALRTHGGAGSVRVYGSNGPIGWTDKALADGPGVILGRKGAYRGVEYSPAPFHVIDTAYYIVPKVELDVRWLFYAIKYHKLGDIDDGSPIPSTTRAAVYVRELDLPPLREQQEMVSTLSGLDDKIELNRRMNATLEAMAQAIFRDWFVEFGPVRRKLAGETDPVAIMGGLTPDPTRADELAALFPAALGDNGLPEGWLMTTLGEYAHLNPESWSSRAAPAHVQYVDLSNTKWGEIESVSPFSWAEAPSRARRVARRGDTLVGTVRPGNGSYTYIGIEGLTASTGFAQLRPKAAHLVDLVYIAATNSENIERLSLLADGGAYPAVNPSVVLDTTLPAIPPDLTVAFAEFASPIRALVEHRKSENRALAETRDYLLPRLMSGAVRVGDVTHQEAAA